MSNKTISINPDLFKIKKQTKRKKEKNNNIVPTVISPSLLKNKLLKKIKEHSQLNNSKIEQNKDTINLANDEYADSLNYLETISNNKHVIKHNNTAKISHINLPSNESVPYGILKGGNKPCYSEWKKRTLKFKQNEPTKIENKPHNTLMSAIDIVEPMNVTSLNTSLNNNNKNNLNNMINLKKNKTQTHVKYKVGKSLKNGTVGLLLKDNKTRKNIENEKRELRQHDIHKIKAYLKKHNLIRAGESNNIPVEMLKQLYESSVMSGEIINANTNVMLHNLTNEL